MKPTAIAEQLAQHAESVCRKLLPEGKRDGSEWRAGSVAGEPGQSLGVHLKGDKAGVWSDFAEGSRGDLLDLWCAARGVELTQAMDEAKAFLGITEAAPDKPKKAYKNPHKPRCRAPKDDPETQWLKQTRSLSPEAIRAYQIAVASDTVVFPFKRGPAKDAEVTMVKKRRISDGDCRPSSADQRPTLFGWQAIPSDARTVCICEGELDAPSLWDYGIPALSVPFGAGTGHKQQWIEHEYEALERFDMIWLCFDADEEGRAAAYEVAERLGIERCRIVTLPKKDPNECLKADMPVKDVWDAFEAAPYVEHSAIHRASRYAQDVYYAIYPEKAPVDESAIQPPWNKAEDCIEFRMAELMILNGVNGHGKTQFAGWLMLTAARQEAVCCVASMEIPTKMLLGGMTKQAAGRSDPSWGYIQAITDWMDDRILQYAKKGQNTADEILEAFRYAAKRYGATFFVVDSLLMVGIDEDDYNEQKRFVLQLAQFKNEFNVFVLLLTHSRKKQDENEPTGKMDIRGSGAITDLVDTVGTIWRNKPKERKLRNHNSGSSPLDEEGLQELIEKPDALWYIEKQRNHPRGWEGQIALWFDRDSLQYLAGPNHTPNAIVDYSGPTEEAA